MERLAADAATVNHDRQRLRHQFRTLFASELEQLPSRVSLTQAVHWLFGLEIIVGETVFQRSSPLIPEALWRELAQAL